MSIKERCFHQIRLIVGVVALLTVITFKVQAVEVSSQGFLVLQEDEDFASLIQFIRDSSEDDLAAWAEELGFTSLYAASQANSSIESIYDQTLARVLNTDHLIQIADSLYKVSDKAVLEYKVTSNGRNKLIAIHPVRFGTGEGQSEELNPDGTYLKCSTWYTNYGFYWSLGGTGKTSDGSKVSTMTVSGYYTSSKGTTQPDWEGPETCKNASSCTDYLGAGAMSKVYVGTIYITVISGNMVCNVNTTYNY